MCPGAWHAPNSGTDKAPIDSVNEAQHAVPESVRLPGPNDKLGATAVGEADAAQVRERGTAVSATESSCWTERRWPIFAGEHGGRRGACLSCEGDLGAKTITDKTE